MGIQSETPFEKKWRLWQKGERVTFKAYSELKGIVEEEARLYPSVLWPGEKRAYLIHASEILPGESESEQPVIPLSKEDPTAEDVHAALYRGEHGGLFLAAEAPSFSQAHDLSRALTPGWPGTTMATSPPPMGPGIAPNRKLSFTDQPHSRRTFHV